MSKPFIIFGVGDLAEVAFQYALYGDDKSPDRFEPVAFTCDEKYIPQEGCYLGLPVIPFEKSAIESYWTNVQSSVSNSPAKRPQLLIPISYTDLNAARARKYAEAKSWELELITLIHPAACVNRDATIGDNCFIGDLVSLQPNTRIGCDTVIRSQAYIGHHSRIGDHCWISAGAKICGKVKVGNNCFIGAGAIIRDGVEIADNNLIAMGAIITRSTNTGEKYLSGVNQLSSF